jgi:branched-subunit amino acid transport protein
LSDAWTTVLVVGVATVALKGAGPVLVGGRPLPERLVAVVELLAPALLAALVVVNAFAAGRHLAIDARAAGLAAAAIAIAMRAPVLVVVVAAAAVAALVRLVS